jgi:hypothetical protein
VDLKPRLDGTKNLAPLGFDPRTIHPVANYCPGCRMIVKVKVKFTLEEATNAQRRSRGVALLFS